MALLTQEQINERLEEVKKIKVSLDPDPLTKGLASLNSKLQEVQASKDRVCTLLMESMRNSAEAEILKETVQAEYDRQIELLLATDTTVSSQKSAEMRTTHAKLKCPDLVLKLHRADVNSLTAGWYQKCLQLVASNLESANSNISRQISVIQMEQNLSGIPSANRGQVGQIRTINL